MGMPDELLKWKRLLDDGVIDAKQLEAARAELLSAGTQGEAGGATAHRTAEPTPSLQPRTTLSPGSRLLEAVLAIAFVGFVLAGVAWTVSHIRDSAGAAEKTEHSPRDGRPVGERSRSSDAADTADGVAAVSLRALQVGATAAEALPKLRALGGHWEVLTKDRIVAVLGSGGAAGRVYFERPDSVGRPEAIASLPADLIQRLGRIPLHALPDFAGYVIASIEPPDPVR